jgi:small redox-active disulfide protein 2
VIVVVKIEVLGTGCAKCKSLLKNVERAVQETGIPAEIVKVDSLQEIMSRGVMMVPALYVDGEAMAVGRAPNVEEIKMMIKKRG